MNLRARLRRTPCRVGWHQFVLAWNGRTYVTVCEHCGKEK